MFTHLDPCTGKDECTSHDLKAEHASSGCSRNQGLNLSSQRCNWSNGTYVNFTNVYADHNGVPSSQLVLGASDPSTWINPSRCNRRDFSCDNLPNATQNRNDTWTEDTHSDLRAKAEFNGAFGLLRTYTAVDGTVWDEINFNGTAGWIKGSDTMNGQGVIVTFTGGTAPTTIYGKPVHSSTYAICDDAANGFSRAGQTYVARVVYTDSQNVTWYKEQHT